MTVILSVDPLLSASSTTNRAAVSCLRFLLAFFSIRILFIFVFSLIVTVVMSSNEFETKSFNSRRQMRKITHMDEIYFDQLCKIIVNQDKFNSPSSLSHPLDPISRNTSLMCLLSLKSISMSSSSSACNKL